MEKSKDYLYKTIIDLFALTWYACVHYVRYSDRIFCIALEKPTEEESRENLDKTFYTILLADIYVNVVRPA